MLTRRMVVLIVVAVVLGVASAAIMTWASGNHPAKVLTGEAGCGGGGACMMKAGTSGGGCPMEKAMAAHAQNVPGYYKVNAKSQALWSHMGKLIDQHRAAVWHLFAVESQKSVSKTKLASAREQVTTLSAQITKTRIALAAYWQRSPSAVAVNTTQGANCGCPAQGGPNCGCTQKTK